LGGATKPQQLCAMERKREGKPFVELRSVIDRETMVSKEPQPVQAL